MEKVRYLEFSGLLNIGVTDFNKPVNELSAMKNCYEYEIGKLQKVPGYSLISNSQVVDTKSVNFLHYYNQPSSGNNYLIAGSDSGSDYIFEYIAPDLGSPITSWTSITSGTITGRAGAEISAVNYLGKVFGVGIDGSTYLSPFTISTITYSTADSDLTSMAKGKYIVKYRDLLYVLNCYITTTKYSSRAYFCSTPTAGAITWTVATDFIEFGYDDGDEITGGCEAFDRLIVFKHFSMWKYDETERKQIADIGCDSFKSIVKVDGIPYWFNRFGIWRWGGAQPQLISNKVGLFIDAITQTNLANCIGVQYNREYRLFIGDVTVNGISYTNTWLCFDTQKEKWYVRCTFNTVKSASLFIEASKQRTYFGDDDGYVYKFANKVDNIYSDNGNEIDSFFVTNNLDLGAPEIKKFTNHMTVFSKNPQGMTMSVDKDNLDTYNAGRNIVLNKNIEDLDIASEGYRYRFKFTEKSKNQSWEFEGFVISSDIISEDI